MVDPTKNYFEVLGLSSGASPEDIKKAFKQIAFQYHPDRNPHNAWAEEKFRQAVEAYTYLSGNLEAYHALKTESKTAKATVERSEDILKILFDIDIEPATSRQKSLEVVLPLSLEEAFLGGEKKLSLNRQDRCLECQGSGVEPGAKVFTCTYCFGEGRVGMEQGRGLQKECPKCNGRGFISSRGCVRCRGRGVVEKQMKIKVQIPPRSGEGRVLRIAGEGHEFRPGRRGEVRVTVHLKNHPSFTFDGGDIICETTIAMSEAALGGDILIPTLGGNKKVHILPGTQSGQVIRLKGMGLGGDQLVRVWVQTPTAISEKDRNFLRRWNRTEGKSFWTKLKKWIW